MPYYPTDGWLADSRPRRHRKVGASDEIKNNQLNFDMGERENSMTVWITILLILILAEVWWFGIHCTTYLSDIRESLAKMTEEPK